MFVILLAMLAGLAIGSFLNVWIIRGEKGETLGGRSRCLSCNTMLSVRELIPIISYLIQKGRCLHCGAAFSIQYPLVELTTSLLFGAAAWLFFLSVPLTLLWILFFIGLLAAISSAIVIGVSDFQFMLIPNGAVLVLIIFGIFAVALRTYQSSNLGDTGGMVAFDLIASFLLSCFIGLLWFISKGRWMGFGDVKLVLATSLIVGFPKAVTALLFAFWIGGIAGLLLLLLKKKGLKNTIPFGPFILLGCVGAYFLTDQFLILTALPEFFL